MRSVQDIADDDFKEIADQGHDSASSSEVEAGSPLSWKKSHEKIPKGSIILEKPGQETGVWERWLFSPGRIPELVPPQVKLPTRCDHFCCLPSSVLFAWPLWVASEGESFDLVRLELSGRHLLKRGMENSLVILPILSKEDRQLVLAVAPDEPFPEDLMPADWKSSTCFELPSRLITGSLDHDLILWEEWGSLQMAFYRNQNPVWFCSVRPEGLSGLIHRISLRLLAEGVLELLPSRILLNGIPTEIATPLITALNGIFPKATVTQSQSETSPLLRNDQIDIPPSEAREERRRAKQRQKLFSFAIAGVILYLLLLIWGAGDLFIRQTSLKRLRQEIAKIDQPALEAQEQSSRWHLLRPVIDPNTFALDLLAAVAAPTSGGKVRLTLFSLEQGKLHLSGEAGDLTQANSSIETLKKNPLLQEYDWNASQPQLAGKNSVKFDMEGTRPDAPHAASSPENN